MDPLKIKLTYWEAEQLVGYVFQASRLAYNPQAREELIVLAEYYPKIEQQAITIGRRSKSKHYNYNVPISVARILHRRWQQEEITPRLQMVLNALDYGLTQRGLKPDPVKPELF